MCVHFLLSFLPVFCLPTNAQLMDSLRQERPSWNVTLLDTTATNHSLVETMHLLAKADVMIAPGGGSDGMIFEYAILSTHTHTRSHVYKSINMYKRTTPQHANRNTHMHTDNITTYILYHNKGTTSSQDAYIHTQTHSERERNTQKPILNHPLPLPLPCRNQVLC